MKILVCCHEKKSRHNHTKSVFLSNGLFILKKSLPILAHFFIGLKSEDFAQKTTKMRCSDRVLVAKIHHTKPER